jgi:hypothetical protein
MPQQRMTTTRYASLPPNPAGREYSYLVGYINDGPGFDCRSEIVDSDVMLSTIGEVASLHRYLESRYQARNPTILNLSLLAAPANHPGPVMPVSGIGQYIYLVHYQTMQGFGVCVCPTSEQVHDRAGLDRITAQAEHLERAAGFNIHIKATIGLTLLAAPAM